MHTTQLPTIRSQPSDVSTSWGGAVQWGPQVKKFEQVSSLGHQMSPGEGLGLGPSIEGGQDPVQREVRILYRGGQGPVQRGVRVPVQRGPGALYMTLPSVTVGSNALLGNGHITFPQLCWWAVKTIGSSFNGCNGHFLIVLTCWGLGISRWSMLKRVNLVKMARSNILAIEECICLSKLQNRRQEHNRMTPSNHQKGWDHMG